MSILLTTPVPPGPSAAVPTTAGGESAPHRGRQRLPDLPLESGGVLRAPVVAYRSWGAAPQPDGSNVVVLLHALTGDSHVAGPGGPSHAPRGWWPEQLGPGAPLDTRRLHVIAPDVLGGCSGSTGPATPGPGGQRLGSRMPRLTVRDQVAAEVALLRTLGIRSVAHVIGASAGGMRALEWAAQGEVAVGHAVVVAAPAAASADLRAALHLQRLAVTTDPAWHGGDYRGAGPVTGLGLARRAAMLTYRSADGLRHRFDAVPSDPGTPAEGGVEDWLDHHARRFVDRFDAGAYVHLIDAMATHDVGRGRGGVRAALAGLRAPVTAVALSGDRFVPPQEVAELAALSGGRLRTLRTRHGHDGFLIETDAVSHLLRDLLP